MFCRHSLKQLSPKPSTKSPSTSQEVLSHPLVQVCDGRACSQQTLQHSLILEWLSWWELGNCCLLCLTQHPPSAQSCCQQWSEEAKRGEAGLGGEGCGQHKPTSALGQISHSTADGQTNCTACQTHSACWWSSLILEAFRERLYIWWGDGTRGVGGGASLLHNSEYQKMDDFTVRDYFVSFHPALPRAICFICFPLCLSLGFHKAQHKMFYLPANQSEQEVWALD